MTILLYNIGFSNYDIIIINLSSSKEASNNSFGVSFIFAFGGSYLVLLLWTGLKIALGKHETELYS